AFFNVYLDTELSVDVALVGAVMGAAQLLPFAVALVMPSVLATRGAESSILWVGVLLGIALLVMALVPHWFAASISYTLVVSTMTAGGIARGLFSQELVAQQWRTASSAVLTIGMALGGASMAALGGYLIGAAGFSVLFMAGMGCALLSAAVVLVYRRLRLAQSESAAAQP
ncbi:MAG: MFS transporter, partial [Caldilineaceae bacterium]|nr:MFS transporter [Caldilineaceae bacterium]